MTKDTLLLYIPLIHYETISLSVTVLILGCALGNEDHYTLRNQDLQEHLGLKIIIHYETIFTKFLKAFACNNEAIPLTPIKIIHAILG